MSSHRSILAQLRPFRTLAEELTTEGVEIGPSGVGMWSVRDDIPAEYFPALIRVAAKRGVKLTLENLHGSDALSAAS